MLSILEFTFIETSLQTILDPPQEVVYGYSSEAVSTGGELDACILKLNDAADVFHTAVDNLLSCLAAPTADPTLKLLGLRLNFNEHYTTKQD